MKKSIKLLSAMLMIVVLVFSLTGCGVDMSKVKGDWKLKTFDGKTVEDYLNNNQSYIGQNVTITDKEIKYSYIEGGQVVTKTYETTVKSNGVEGYANKDDKSPAVSFKPVDGNLQMDGKGPDGKVITLVFEKGTRDLQKEYNDAVAALTGGAEEGGEEGGEEEGGEEE